VSRIIYLGLGSNLGDRDGYIAAALALLEALGLEILAVSDIENTKALIVTGQPDFLNCVVKVRGDMSAHNLLREIKQIERKVGRVFRYDKGPREIDIDILLYGDECVDSDDLVIPHPGIKDRPFVLRQLLQIDPGLRDPKTGLHYSDIIV